MRILIVGHGRMGRLVESLAGEYGCEVAGIIDGRSGESAQSKSWEGVDVAIDFSTPAAVGVNVPVLAGRGIDLVVGTTGWQRDEAAVRDAVHRAGVGAVVAPNFSPGVVIFEDVARRTAALFAQQPDFGAWVHEAHHATKKDAPSGTALLLKRAMEAGGYSRPIDVSSTRAGHIPGSHEVGFDGPAESFVLSHETRDRSTFARGALVAAKWVKGKRGWFTMRDVLGLVGRSSG
jgi:4-hydroxy-tetrahydrodipicolinate reductase